MKKINWKIYVGTAASVVILCVILLFVCKKGTYAFSDYAYINPMRPTLSTADSNVTLDGVLDESIWANQRKFYSSLKTDESITLQMTTYNGQDGIYLAFDVNDPAVYYSNERTSTNNSGVELYISSMDGAKDITGHAYEIDLSAFDSASCLSLIIEGSSFGGANQNIDRMRISSEKDVAVTLLAPALSELIACNLDNKELKVARIGRKTYRVFESDLKSFIRKYM